jgi:hypothetical protein
MAVEKMMDPLSNCKAKRREMEIKTTGNFAVSRKSCYFALNNVKR